MYKYITPRLIFLVGILTGVSLQLPYIKWLQRTPAIVAEPIPNHIYDLTTVRKFTIGHVPAWPTWPTTRNNNLRITIASSSEVNRMARHLYVLDTEDELAGFYDPIQHEIWCVNSTEVLVHELRHVFEGSFHRDLLLVRRK